MKEVTRSPGDRLLATLSALANPHRLRILGALAANGRNYVSQLARDIGISRPLLHLHLQRLEDAGLVTSRHELSADGKALNYFESSISRSTSRLRRSPGRPAHSRFHPNHRGCHVF